MAANKPKRPWKVRFWDQEHYIWRGSTFASSEAATKFAERLISSGYTDVSAWLQGEDGYVVGMIRLYA